MLTKASKLPRYHAARLEVLRRSMRARHRTLVEEMAEEATKLTGGSITSAQLRAMGHPFARRRKKSLRALRKLPINVQSGRLQRSMRIISEKTAGKVQSYRLQFTSRSSIVLRKKGTKFMVARGFWTAMNHAYKRKRAALLRRNDYESSLQALRAKYARN